MSSLFALILFAAAPEAATAAPLPAPQARVVGVARARILAPVRVSLGVAGQWAQTGDPAAPRLLTSHQVRRDGARVIDCY